MTETELADWLAAVMAQPVEQTLRVCKEVLSMDKTIPAARTWVYKMKYLFNTARVWLIKNGHELPPLSHGYYRVEEYGTDVFLGETAVSAPRGAMRLIRATEKEMLDMYERLHGKVS